MAEVSCGPPMTVTPTQSMRPSSTARIAVPMKSRSMLPSMMVGACLPSSAADRFRTASGKRALRCEVIVGLISRMCFEDVMTASGPGPASV